MRKEQVADLYPLTPLQRGMLFHSVLAPEAGEYLAQACFVLEGELDPPSFEAAWRLVVARHAALRTAFVWQGVDEPVQVVLREVVLPFVSVDWRAHSPAEQRVRAEEHLRADRRAGFELTRAPLLRVHLARLADGVWRVTLSSHHLLFDGWSMPIVLGEVFATHAALARGREPAFAVPRPYRDYLAWLRRRDPAAARVFWRERLAGARPTALPGLRRSTIAGKGHVGTGAEWGDLHAPLDGAQSKRLNELARGAGLTLATLVQGAFALFLARLCGTRDVLFGVTRAGRPAELEGVESMVGMFVNTLPLRAVLEGDARVLEWLRELQVQGAELGAHEWSSLSDIATWCDFEAGRPLFEALVVVENYPLAEGAELWGELALRELRSLERTDMPLNLIVTPGERVDLRLSYDPARLDGALVQRWAVGLRRLLLELLERPDARTSEITSLDEDERRTLLVDWARGPEPELPARTLAELFAEQVRNAPDALALAQGERSCSYAELDARSERVARELAALGLGREDVVAVCTEPTFDSPIAALGVHRAGAAFAPLDPAHPTARLTTLLAACRPRALLTTRALLEGRPELRQCVREVLCLEELLAGDAPPLAGREPRAEDLVYVIHTSGSTGAPKAVEVSGLGLASLVHATASAAELGPGRRVAQNSAASFDVSVLELLAAVSSGATLCLPGRVRPAPGPELEAWLRAEHAQVLFATPSVLGELDPARLPELDALFVGGESISSELALHWSSSGRRLMQSYGPAEASVTALEARLEGAELDGRRPPIGRPLPGVVAYLLDARLEPVPTGAVGELYLGGAGLARGYRGEPARSAERFLPDPFAEQPGARLYRTGDRARWRPDAAGGALLEFQGRVDRQLKVRGVRVEPGEVEAVLQGHPLVQQAVVDLHGEGSAAALCAWYVPRGAAGEEAAELRRYLAERLPPALVPAYYVALEALPRSASGKLERRALPAPAAREETRAPRTTTPVLDLVCAQVAAVLGLGRVGPGEDFFALGGHSLRAMQLVSRLRSALGIELPLREVFAAADLADLARRCEAQRRTAQQRTAEGAAQLPDPREFSGPGARPLSFAQERMWFLERLAPGSPQYVMPAGLWIAGELDADALERAFAELIARHAALRTRFEEGPAGPRQVVASAVPFSLERIELAGSEPLAAREAQALARAAELARRPFDLSSPPLLRASLLRLEPERHLLVLALHHAAADGWSVAIVLRELALLYRAQSGGAPAELAPLALEVQDHALWQRDERVRAALERDVEFFLQELEGSSGLLELPTCRPRPPVQSHAGDSVKLALPGELCRSIEALARRRGATPFLVLLAAFQAFLARLTGQDDLLVGVPIAGRDRPELEPLVGLFVNTLPLRARMAGDPSFRAHLERTRERVLAAWDHQNAPFERLVERSGVGRDLGRSPLVQVLFVMQNLSVPDFELPGLACELLELDTGTSKFDLTLLVDELEGGRSLGLTLEYDSELFERATAEVWLGSFAELLSNALADPERSLSELEWLPAAERAQLARWGERPRTFPADATLPERFAAQVARTPTAVALSFAGRTLTYAQLQSRVRHLAHELVRQGVGPEVRVALSCRRSFELVTGMLAVLEAGGAYVPLDPLQPAERRRWMLADSRAAVLLAQPELAAELDPPAGVHTILLEESWEEDLRTPREEPACARPLPENLAYLMYTSGSTGVPKGVGVPHRAVARLLCGEPFVELGPTERVLQFVSSAFDVSVFEIFGALLSGARLEIFAPHLPSLAELGRFVRERGVTTMWLTKGLFDQMIEAEAASLGGVRQLLAGGEALSAPHVERALRELPACRIVNGYGPTEVTCFTTTHTFERDAALYSPVPIGRPIEATRLFVLDRNLRPVPRGVAGELYAAGEGLARGYVGDPALTARRFLPDPFGAQPGGRLYRIGDLARWRSDGTLEYLGRVDRQVKVRGHRVELGEIEAALAAHPAVQQCAVELLGEGEERRPVAWYVATETLTHQELREFLRTRLSEPVLPGAFVQLDALPLTPNGKVDRRALPAPVARRTAEPTPPAALTAEEELLAGAWRELLNLDEVRPEDDFFESGGHSLLATRLVVRIRELFGLELPLQRVFERSTLAELARELAQLRAASGPAPLELVRESAPAFEIDAPAPLSFAQERLWFLERFTPGNPAHHTPMALELRGELDARAMRLALEGLVHAHPTLRTRFPERAGRAQQEVVPADTVHFELPFEDLAGLASDARDERLHELGEREARRAFDLDGDLLLRALLVRLGPQHHVLLLALHHIASDGWSLSILMGELGEFYTRALNGEALGVREPRSSYAEVAREERRAAERGELEADLAWWRAELEGASERLELGGATAPAGGALRPGAGFSLDLPAELARDLEALGRRSGATLFMVLLAAFQVLLARAGGRKRFVIGSPHAGRGRRALEQLVGPFVNLLPLRADLRGDPSFAELLDRVRTTTLGAFAHAALPVERLAPLLRPEGDPRGGELFQATLTFHNMPAARLELEGLTVQRLPLETGVAFGELWLALERRDDGSLEAYWHHDTGILLPERAAHLAAAWRRMLEAALQDPEQRCSRLPLLEPGEHEHLLELGRVPGAHPRGVTVAELFARQAARTPDAMALRCGDESLSYAELAARANRLARQLVELGVGPEVRVALLLERSVEQIVAVLAVAAAGGAYVPLDPALPARRLGRALELSQAALVLTLERYADELPAQGPGGPYVVALDTEGDALAAQSAEALGPRAGPTNLAYVMFTSGSTGEPKPVGVEHRSIVRLVAGTPFATHGSDEAVLGLAPLSFDASTFELWWTLTGGARLELFGPHTPSLEELGRFVRERGITTMWLSAGLFHQLVDAGLEDLRSLRQILAGGEALSAAHVERALRELPACRVLNGYGPTEVTTFTCTQDLRAADLPVVPIGRPINGTRVYVLDAELEPVPAGTFGELFAGGEGLARGYLNDARLCAERFLPDPFGAEAGARLYRTGDRARWRADGTLEYGGRLDRQVKLRGYRIEPGEVEAVLAQHAAVRACAVELRGSDAHRRLCAWVAARAGADVAELRSYLAERLPAYMVPSSIALLDALPLTANGKLDRSALREERAPRAPRRRALANPQEELLAGIWSRVLERPTIGPEDDFFELGGHSLLATQLASRVREVFGVELPLQLVFEHPTLRALALEIARLEGGPAPAAEPQLPRERPADLPLTFGQERLWFLERLAPGKPTYNVPFALEIEGELDRAALAFAFGEVLRRHEALRTSFPARGGRPRQEISPPAAGDLELPLRDLSELGEAQRRERLAEREEQLARRPFDLERGPLLRTELVLLAPGRHVLLLCLHHLVCDGWSLALLTSELSACYRARLEGRAPTLEPLSVQVADHALWQRRWMDGERLQTELAWWRAELEGAARRIEPLPGSNSSLGTAGARGAILEERLAPDATAAIEALARSAGATLFMVLLTAYQALLARLSGTRDLVVGAPIAGRNRPHTEGLIGFLVNTLALRADFAEAPTFRAQLARVRARTLAAYQHQDLPFDRLAPDLAPRQGSRGDAPLQFLFALQNAPPARLELAGCEVRVRPLGTGEPHAELSLALQRDEDGGLTAAFEYDSARWSPREIAAFARAWRALLEQVCADPDARPFELPLALGEERDRELARARGPRTQSPAGAGLFELFEERARRAPKSPAVEAAGISLSYGELLERAENLARALCAAGVGREERVGLLAARADLLALGALGCLRADAAYLPLDPTQPDARLAAILADAGARVVLCETHHRARLERLGARTFDLETAVLDRDDAALPDVRGRGAGLAYVVYTSGSTGEPKGVLVDQRAVVRLVHGAEYLALSPEKRVGRASNPAFDALTFELWGALLHGATLVDLEQDTLLDPLALAAALRTRGLSHLFLTTALFQSTVRGAPRAFESLERLLFGGERCDPALVGALLAEGAPRHLLHVYGPTETTTFASYCELERPAASTARAQEPVPIGGPIPATELYVLDAALEPVPDGLSGELYIGGEGLARGYLGRGAASAARFVPDPFSGVPGARLYRSGDRVRRDARGRLEFLGRLDGQIKLRGLRIEPGEIEAALEACSDVRQAAVGLRTAPGGEERLVAWVELEPGATLQAARLRSELAERLPSWMLPAHLSQLAALPLGRTAKIERRALPDPDWSLPFAKGPRGAASEDPLEQLVAAIWCEVLGLERVEHGDDFFELGGHSLLAAQVLARLSAALKVELPLRAIFEASVLGDLARRAADARGGAEPVPLPAPRPGPREGPLSFAQHRMWFLQRLAPQSPFYNVPLALHLKGALDESALEGALCDFVARHEPLRTRLVSGEHGPLQVVEAPGEVSFARCDLRAHAEDLREAKLAQVLREEGAAVLDLGSAQPWRATLIRLGPTAHVFSFVVHHALSDGWSLDVLVRELGELYRARVEGRSPRLEPLAVQYLEVASWQRERIAGARGELLLERQRARLAGAPQTLELFPDHARPPVQRFEGAAAPFELSEPLSASLRRLARAEGATPFLVLLAAFVELLHRRSGAIDLCLGTPIAGRDRPELEGLFGLLVDTLVLRADLSGEPSFVDLLARVRESFLAAYELRELPFEQVVEALAPQRDTGRSPLVQVLFTLQNAPRRPLGLPGVVAELIEPEDSHAKLDLVLALRETEAGIEGAFEYDVALFEPATIEGLARAYVRLLESALAEPSVPISSLRSATEEERAAWLDLGRAAQRAEGDAPVQRLFEEHARAAPAAPAIEGADGCVWSYGELDARAERLAARLCELGVGPEAVVGLCAARSPELVLGALAVLKAGGAYLALDSAAPAERTRALLADARAKVLLVDRSAPPLVRDGERTAAGATLHVEELEHYARTEVSQSDRARPDRVHSECGAHAAYVIYTSGSTGAPKGVVVPQRGLSNLAAWHRQAYGVRPSDRASLIAGTSFDASIWEIWPYLSAGAALVVVPEDVRLDPPRLGRWLAARRISLAFLPTPLGEALLELDEPADSCLRALLVGGDRLHGPGRGARRYELYNHYGPTEASVVTSACAVPQGEDSAPPPIGRPIAGLDAFVLDASLEPVSSGAPGELCVSGIGLARGYVGRARETALAFVPNPHARVPGERLYRSGDLVRWNGAGELVFLGRRDRQVKLAGQRLELGEVEALLVADPSLREAAVVARPGPRGVRDLVAYVVRRTALPLDRAALRERLARRLGQALLPAHIVELEQLPLLPSGKIDRGALPEPPAAEPLQTARPATELERTLAQVFRAVLGRAEVCTRTSFFEQGGTSLALLEVQARLTTLLGREVPVIELFRQPTIVELARWLEQGAQDEAPGSERAQRRRAARDRRGRPR